MPNSPAVLILAGGRSTRMGTDKAALTLEGKTLLQRAVDFWRGAMPEAKIYISVGQHSPQELPEGTAAISDLAPNLGPLSGLQAAFHATDATMLYVSAVDMPLLKREALDHLNRHRSGAEDICVFQRKGNPEPLFGCYRRSCINRIDEMLSQGNCRMRDLIDSLSATLIPLPDETWLTNVNTPEEFTAVSRQS